MTLALWTFGHKWSQNQWCHFGVGEFATHFSLFSGDWDVHRGYGILTPGQMAGARSTVSADAQSLRIPCGGLIHCTQALATEPSVMQSGAEEVPQARSGCLAATPWKLLLLCVLVQTRRAPCLDPCLFGPLCWTVLRSPLTDQILS